MKLCQENFGMKANFVKMVRIGRKIHKEGDNLNKRENNLELCFFSKIRKFTFILFRNDYFSSKPKKLNAKSTNLRNNKILFGFQLISVKLPLLE